MEILFCLFLNFVEASYATDFTSKNFNEIKEMKVGDSYLYLPTNYRITLKKIQKHVSQCAVPGFNCGASYHPDPSYTPIFDIEADAKCKNRIMPEVCNVTHKVLKTDLEKSAQVTFTQVYDACLSQTNKSNRNSCILNTTVNHYDAPPREPKNCDLIKDDEQARDHCIQRIADKLSDHTLCDLMKGDMGFQCTLLKAKFYKDPKLCKALKRGPFHHTEQQWQDEINSCLSVF